MMSPVAGSSTGIVAPPRRRPSAVDVAGFAEEALIVKQPNGPAGGSGIHEWPPAPIVANDRRWRADLPVVPLVVGAVVTPVLTNRLEHVVERVIGNSPPRTSPVDVSESEVNAQPDAGAYDVVRDIREPFIDARIGIAGLERDSRVGGPDLDGKRFVASKEMLEHAGQRPGDAIGSRGVVRIVRMLRRVEIAREIAGPGGIGDRQSCRQCRRRESPGSGARN